MNTAARVPPAIGIVARWAGAALGIWLMAAPAVLRYGGAAENSDRFVGPLIATFSICAAWQATGGMRWLNMPAAAWLLAGPWILGFPPPAAINSVVVAVLLVAATLVPLQSKHRFGGGWRELFR